MYFKSILVDDFTTINELIVKLLNVYCMFLSLWIFSATFLFEIVLIKLLHLNIAKFRLN
jgi:hypothetical protein